MFEYAFARSLSIKNKEKLVFDMSEMTNISHNVYALDKFNIADTKIIDRYNIEKNKYFSYKLLNSILFRINKKYGIHGKYIISKITQRFFNLFGLYVCEDGYVKTGISLSKDKFLNGFFQSSRYFDKYSDIISNELKVKTPLMDKNKKVLKDILESNSICVHIRRGDYTVVTNHLVCTIEYYKKAIKLMKSKIKNPKFFIFSDDINWVEENINIDDNVVYIKQNNPNYEEFRLMYSCKNFIISNSSFSWWAQYLSNNKKKVVISPSKWFNDSNQQCDIYEKDWLIINV